MAAIAQRDQEKRTVQVDRKILAQTLRRNLRKHIADYEEAMAGYKTVLLSKIEDSFREARQKLESRFASLTSKVMHFSDEDIAKQHDYVTILEGISVEMKVPRSYAKEYEAAIDMAEWDVRDTLELSHAEFTCFVRDQWDWKTGFEAVSMLYKSIGVGG